MHKSQASMEYLLITGFSLALAMPLLIIFFYNSSAFNQDMILSQMERVASEIMDASESVYYYGEPSQKMVQVYIPQNLYSTDFGGGYIRFQILQNGNPIDIYRYSRINFTGNISLYPGLHNIKVRAINNTVDITEGG